MPQQEISGANRRAADRLAYAGASARRSPQPGSHTFLVDDSSWHCPKAPWRAAPRCAKMVPPFQMRVSHQLVGFRRDSPIASRPGESRLAERTPAVRPWWRELYKLPPCGHCQHLTTARSRVWAVGHYVSAFRKIRARSPTSHSSISSMPQAALVEPLSKRRNLRILSVTREDNLPAIAIRTGGST